MKSRILLAILALLVLGSCTNDAPPDAQSLRLHFSCKYARPDRDSLLPLYPNPYSHSAGDTTVTIEFMLKDSSRDAHLLIQNVIGDEVASYTDSVLAPGIYRGAWNPIAADGTPLQSGLYFVTLRSATYINSRLLNLQDND
jgi:hypothetical protein